VTLDMRVLTPDELIAARRQERIKAEARAAIYDALVRQATVGKNPIIVTSNRELRWTLGLERIRLRLFGKSLWHLDAGDRHPEGKRLVRVSRVAVDGRRELNVVVVHLPTRPKPALPEIQTT